VVSEKASGGAGNRGPEIILSLPEKDPWIVQKENGHTRRWGTQSQLKVIQREGGRKVRSFFTKRSVRNGVCNEEVQCDIGILILDKRFYRIDNLPVKKLVHLICSPASLRLDFANLDEFGAVNRQLHCRNLLKGSFMVILSEGILAHVQFEYRMERKSKSLLSEGILVVPPKFGFKFLFLINDTTMFVEVQQYEHHHPQKFQPAQGLG
jgi:hypothetical protein